MTTPLSGKIFIGRMGLAMVSQCTKFEVSSFTRYEAMNGGAKCRKWGGLGRLRGTQGHRQCDHSIELVTAIVYMSVSAVMCGNIAQRVNSLCFIQRSIKSYSISLFLVRTQSLTDTNRL